MHIYNFTVDLKLGSMSPTETELYFEEQKKVAGSVSSGVEGVGSDECDVAGKKFACFQCNLSRRVVVLGSHVGISPKLNT